MYDMRKWRSFLTPYDQAVQELKVKLRSIRNEYRDENEYSPIEFVTGRVKKISSIVEKSKRKSIPMEYFELFIDDIAGIRIMCQFSDDIYRVVGLLRKRSGSDMYILYEKDYVKHAKSSGYRSYHMIIKYPVHTAFGHKNVLVEIQIRTLAMNFWATIEHSLNYKYSSNIPENIRMRLRNSAESAARLDDEMFEIKNEIIDAQLLFEKKSSLIYDISFMIDRLNARGRKSSAEEISKKLEEIWGYNSISAFQKLLEEARVLMPEMY